MDVETTGYPIGHHAYGLRTIQLGDALEGIDLDATDPGALELATRLIADAPELNAHSATADLAPLAFETDGRCPVIQTVRIPKRL